MNTKGNRRYGETENRIEEVLLDLLNKKSLEKVTVSDICASAGIHRTTFYSHYEDIYALMDSVLSKKFTAMMEQVMPEENGTSFPKFHEFFSFIRQNKKFFRYYLNNGARSPEKDIFLPDLLLENIKKRLETKGYVTGEELYYHNTFFLEGLKGIIRRWILRDCREEPEELCRIIEEEYNPQRRDAKEIFFS
ncbi:MAG TPA: TetR/AcrR family transcriptional regulator [Lachnospiraceae bacterium]|nr:TetR/AcrR family transcriptional regulator [Lachnospiraceae bacterium]